jgi:hypothetical protein
LAAAADTLVVDEVIGDGRLALIQRHAEAGQCMFLPMGVPFETARSVARPSLARDRVDQFRDAKFTTAKPKTNKSINWIADTRPCAQVSWVSKLNVRMQVEQSSSVSAS